MPGVEDAKGLVEKVPGLIQFPFVVRVLVPGFAATAILWMLMGWQFAFPQDLKAATKLSEFRSVLSALGLALAFGSLIGVVLADRIYKIYEGLVLWPRTLTNLCTRWQENRVKRLLASTEGLSGTTDYDRIWFKLRRFPLDANGDPTASRPTLLGNILAEYEDYPKTRYGMDAVFYWPRLWLELDKDKKAEVDSGWSIADGLLSLSAVAVVGGIFWIGAAGVRAVVHVLAVWSERRLVAPDRIPSHLPWDSAEWTAIAGLSLMGFGYLFYRLSLPFHRKNGEVFKALFDLYRFKLVPMSRVSPNELQIWKGVWSYLQYLRIKCSRCPDHHFPANLAKCDVCGTDRAASLDVLGELGKEHRTTTSLIDWLKAKFS